MTLILVHHVEIFVLVTYTDVPCMGGYTRWGIVNICTSMIALINALRSTRCGEGYCGEAFCDKLSCIKGADEDECELTTIASDDDDEEEEDTIQAEYVKMDVPAENLSHVTEAIVDLLCDVDEEPFRCSSGAIVSIKLIIYYSRRERERLGRMGSSYS